MKQDDDAGSRARFPAAFHGTHGQNRTLLSAMTLMQQERKLSLDRRGGDGTPETEGSNKLTF